MSKQKGSVINITPDINFSKHRNSLSKSLDVRDLAGNPIKGSVKRHFNSVLERIEKRYNIKKEAFSLLSIEQLKDLYNNPVKPQVCSSTDKSALADVYFDKQYQIYEQEVVENLNNIDQTQLNEVEKIALKRCIELKTLKEKINSENN